MIRHYLYITSRPATVVKPFRHGAVSAVGCTRLGTQGCARRVEAAAQLRVLPYDSLP